MFTTHSSLRTIAVAAALSCAAPLFGQFTGEYALPASGTYTSDQSFSDWNLAVTAIPGSGAPGASSGQADTTGGPNTLVLSATGGAGNQGFGAGTGSVTFAHTAAVDSTVSFDLNFSGGGSFDVEIDNTPVSPVSSSGSDYSYAFDLTSGETLEFGLSVTGFAGTMDMVMPGPPPDFLPMVFPGMPGSSTSGTITITNFQSISAIPEPGAWAAIFGVIALGVAARKRGKCRLISSGPVR